MQTKTETKWQPIETVPKDGTEVICWDPHMMCCELGHWAHKMWADNSSEHHVPGMVESARIYQNNYFFPTHWMPLPDAPEPITEED